MKDASDFGYKAYMDGLPDDHAKDIEFMAWLLANPSADAATEWSIGWSHAEIDFLTTGEDLDD